MVQPYAGMRVDKVAGMEARGFILGGAVAHQLSVGFVPVRKKGKLPYTVIGEDYALEYGTGPGGDSHRRAQARRTCLAGG